MNTCPNSNVKSSRYLPVLFEVPGLLRFEKGSKVMTEVFGKERLGLLALVSQC